MSQELRLNRIWRAFFICFLCFCFFQVAYLSLKSSFAGLYDIEETYGDGVYYLIINIVCVALFLWGIVRHSLNKTLVPIVLFCGFQFLFFYFAGMPIQYSMRMLSWGIVFGGLFYYLKDRGGENILINLMCVALIILSVYIMSSESDLRQNLSFERGLNEGHWVLLGLPFAFLTKNKWLKIALIASVSITVLLSLKSTTILGLVVSLVVSILVTGKLRNKTRGRGLTILAILLIILTAFWPFISDTLLSKFGVDWGEKIASSTETGGSGRYDIWKSTLDAQFNSSFTQWLLGHGHNTVIKINGFSAHNDYLEILYDYGLLMFGIYIWMCVSLYRRLKVMIRQNNEFAIAFSCSLTLFFVLSMFTHLVIYPGLLITTAICWAICTVSSYKVS